MEFKTEPMSHQRAELENSDIRGRGVFWDMGVGKTWISVVTIAKWYYQGKIDSALIIAPKSMMHQWIQGGDSEWVKHSPLPLNRVSAYQWINKDTRDNIAAQQNVLMRDPNILDIVVVNTEALISVKCREFLTAFYKAHKSTACIVDEASKFKSYKAQRSKVLYKIGAKSTYRRALTGTPVVNSPLDMFGIMRFVDPKVLGTGYTLFRSQFCKTERGYGAGGRTFEKVTGFKNLGKLKRIVDPHVSRVLKEEVLDLPPVTYTTLYAELSPEQRKHYNRMVEEAIVEIEHMEEVHTISASGVLSLLIKLKQIVCGFLPSVEKGGNVPIPGHTRYDVLMEYLELGADKTIIFCDFIQNVDDICKALKEVYGKDCCVRYTGATKNRKEEVDRFINDKSCRFFVSTTSSGNLGLNLTAATTTIYYSTSYNLGDRLQSQDRFYRKGQTKPVTVVDILSPDTIDLKIRQAIIDKREMADLIVDGRVLEWLKEVRQDAKEKG